MWRDLLVDALAAWRITRLVTVDTFPPVKALREAIVEADTHDEWVSVDVDGREVATRQRKPGSLAELVECPWCAGFWVSLAVVVARRVAPKAWDPLATAFAFSGLAGAAVAFEPD